MALCKFSNNIGSEATLHGHKGAPPRASPKRDLTTIGLECREKRGAPSTLKPIVQVQQSGKLSAKRRQVCMAAPCASLFTSSLPLRNLPKVARCSLPTNGRFCKEAQLCHRVLYC